MGAGAQIGGATWNSGETTGGGEGVGVAEGVVDVDLGDARVIFFPVVLVMKELVLELIVVVDDGEALALGTFRTWSGCRLFAATPGFAAIRVAIETPCSAAIFAKVSPGLTVNACVALRNVAMMRKMCAASGLVISGWRIVECDWFVISVIFLKRKNWAQGRWVFT